MGVDRLACGQNHHALDEVFELADVARPGVSEEQYLRLGREPADHLVERAVRLGQEMPRQRQDVLGALAQGRDRDRDDVEPIEQVFTELAFFDHGLE